MRYREVLQRGGINEYQWTTKASRVTRVSTSGKDKATLRRCIRSLPILYSLVTSVLIWLDFDRRSFGQSKDYLIREKKISMAIENELLQERFPKHSHMGTARMIQDKRTIRRSLSWRFLSIGLRDEKSSPEGLSLPNNNAILINMIWYYFIRYGKITMKFN